jgi:hypothetical protein
MSADTIKKFVVRNGEITSREDVLAVALDPALLSKARRAVRKLREGRDQVTVRLPKGRSIVVGLGFGAVPLSEDLFTQFQHANGNSNRELFTSEQQRSVFYILSLQHMELCIAVGDDTPWQNSLVLGAIAGTIVDYSQSLEGPPVMDSPCLQRLCEVQKEITSARPALLCTGELIGVAGAFADSLAIAMLE